MNEYKCICGKCFSNGRSLQSHERTCQYYKQYKVLKLKQIQEEKESRRLPNKMFKCENCGKEHDGSYGSGRFCSEHCRKSFCGKKNTNYTLKGKHQNHNKQRVPFGRWKCNQCEFIGKTRRELQQHKKDKHGNHSVWNKGLTKETDIRILNNAKSVSESMKKLYADGYVNPTQTQEYWTEERRLERSKQKKQLYKEHPEKHPNYKLANNRKQMTYPEKLAFNWLTENKIDFINQYHFVNNEINRYVDFYIPSKNLFIEIDGEHWHEDGNKRDFDKDTNAIKFGIRTLRIKFPSMNVIDTLNKEFGLK